MAQLSPTMEEGKLIEWKVEEGDSISQGDIIAEINREPVRNMAEFTKRAKKLRAGDDLLLHIYRRGGWRYLVVRL